MPRPAGSKIIGGVFYYKHELDATGSPLVIKSAKGYSDTKITPSVPEKPAQRPTEVSENTTQETSSGTGRLEVQEVEVGTNVGGKVQGMHIYSSKEIKHIENTTGLVFVGEFAEQQGALIPVFLRADHDDETRRAKLASIRRGI
jgi:hypothetical protein